jgi:hypothetical protein
MKKFILLPLVIFSLVLLASCEDEFTQPEYKWAWLTHSNFTIDTTNWYLDSAVSYSVTLTNIGQLEAKYIKTQVIAVWGQNDNEAYSPFVNWETINGNDTNQIVIPGGGSMTRTIQSDFNWVDSVNSFHIGYFGKPEQE